MPSPREATLEMPGPLRERLVRRLVQSVATQSREDVRLAGVGSMRARRVLAWPSSSPTIPPVAERVPLAMTIFAEANELYEMLQGRPAPTPRPSDDPELDAFAARVLDAFKRVDAVDVPGLGRFQIHEGKSRRVRMTFAPELKKALNEAARSVTAT